MRRTRSRMGCELPKATHSLYQNPLQNPSFWIQNPAHLPSARINFCGCPSPTFSNSSSLAVSQERGPSRTHCAGIQHCSASGMFPGGQGQSCGCARATEGKPTPRRDRPGRWRGEPGSGYGGCQAGRERVGSGPAGDMQAGASYEEGRGQSEAVSAGGETRWLLLASLPFSCVS